MSDPMEPYEKGYRCGRLLPDGYLNQRYEIRATTTWDYNKGCEVEAYEFVIGWSTRADGGGIAAGAKLHPGWTGVRVVDMKLGTETEANHDSA